MRSEVAIMSRRGFIVAGGAAGAAGAAALLLPDRTPGLAAQQRTSGAVDVRLKATRAAAPLLGSGKPDLQVWAYNGEVPGPEIRVRQGERRRVSVDNDLGQDTTIHWHGVRVPNAMDGVPHLTQAPIRPGGSFTYDFVPQDAGTFWYHPHQRSLEQVGRGLYAPLIVEEKRPITVDRDLTWVLDDWRIDSSGQISGGFGNMMDAMMAGQIGNTITVNGRLPEPLKVSTGERVRLRLINAANARIFQLKFDGHRPQVVAIDGQPVLPHEPDGAVLVGPGSRIDVVLDMMGQPGSRASITDDFYKGLGFQLADIVYSDTALRSEPLATPIALAPNPIPEPELRGAARHEIVFGGGMMGMMGGMMGGGMMGGGGMSGWTVNGVSAKGDVHEPMLTVSRGRTALMSLKNETAWWHPIHLHGHSFRVLARNGKPTKRKEWQDTVLIPPQESAEIAFVADNPGDWMLHCHVLEHQAAGMMAAFRVA